MVLPGTGADGTAIENNLPAMGLPVEAAERDTIFAHVSMADAADRLSRRRDQHVDSAVPGQLTTDRHGCCVSGRAREAQSDGIRIAYAADPTLASLRVVS